MPFVLHTLQSGGVDMEKVLPHQLYLAVCRYVRAAEQRRIPTIIHGRPYASELLDAHDDLIILGSERQLSDWMWELFSMSLS
jgi:hypothetical protein